MTMALTGTGGLFTRTGLWLGEARNVWGFLGNSAPSPASAWAASGPTIDCVGGATTLLEVQYQSALQNIFDGHYAERDNARQALNGYVNALKSRANQTLIQQANNDTALTALTTLAAMNLLISQMTTNSNTITKNTVGISNSATSGNIGNPVVVNSLIQGNGKTSEYIYNETLTATVANDNLHGATAGSEPVTILGQTADQGGLLDWQWPLGSGTSQSLTITDANVNSGTNLLNNSAWANWTGAVPNSWSVLVGGSQISKDTANLYGVATADLQIAGDGSTLTALAQTFNSTNGTAQNLLPNNVYAFNLFFKLSAAAAYGTLAVDLVDGSNNVINNDQSVANTVTVNLTNQTTVTAFNGFFQLPKNPPPTIKLRVRLSTALSNGVNLFINYLALTKPVQLYSMGPYVAMFRGSTDVIGSPSSSASDSWSIIPTNLYNGIFQTGFWRFFNMPSLGLQIPSAASGSIADSLVTA